MKKKLIVLFLLSGLIGQSQDFDFNYDHYSFIVKDLKTVGDFYAEILGLEEIPHPSAPSGFRWFKIRDNSQIHLIGKDSVTLKHSKSVHLSLATQKLAELIAHLEKNNIEYSDWPGKIGAISNRADGVKQIYVQDPENNWVEINTAEH